MILGRGCPSRVRVGAGQSTTVSTWWAGLADPAQFRRDENVGSGKFVFLPHNGGVQYMDAACRPGSQCGGRSLSRPGLKRLASCPATKPPPSNPHGACVATSAETLNRTRLGTEPDPRNLISSPRRRSWLLPDQHGQWECHPGSFREVGLIERILPERVEVIPPIEGGGCSQIGAPVPRLPSLPSCRRCTTASPMLPN